MAEFIPAKRTRIDWIDCAKGIGITLVIIGHTVINDETAVHQAVRGGIFSFHMPLFFILSAITYRFSSDREAFVRKQEKAFRHLIIPMLCVYCLIIIIDAFRSRQGFQARQFITDHINALIYASGVVVNLNDTVIPALGMLWFVVVLYVGRMIYDYIQLRLGDCRKAFILVAVLTVIGVGISRIQWLPFSFDLVLACLPFFWLGDVMGRKVLDMNSPVCGGAAAVIWAGTLLLTYNMTHSYMELAGRRYPLFPLCYLTAIAGTVTAIWISKYLVKIAGFKSLVWLGRNSIVLYYVHSLDRYFSYAWTASGNNVLNTISRVCIDVLICILFVKGKELLFNKREKGNQII